jgi:acyl-CoA reductase-like NAD-dependent aldehyde dehydrogenase
MLIGGSLEAGAGVMGVVNPATARVFRDSPRASAAQLNRAVAAAKAAFPAWSNTAMERRGQILRTMAEVLERHSAELATLLTQEQGKPIAMATAEVTQVARYLRYFANADLPTKRINSGTRSVEIRRRPLGVVGAIVPWNFPLILMAYKVGPALITGNTVVLKPAVTTPLATLRIGELMSDVVPPGTLNVVADAGDLGPLLVAHPDIRKISFTGSTATGCKVMAAAAADLKRVTLELGGNDAAIVLADADVRTVAPKLFQAAFYNSGQACIAIKRLYVHHAIYEQMCAELAALAERAVVGDGLDENTQFGPVQNRMQYDRVLDIVEDARKHGSIVAGGVDRSREGFFIRPTIVRDIAEGARLVDEEQFGPALPLIRFTDPEDALARANNSPYGLGGSIWSSDLAQARDLASRMDAGTVWINRHLDLAPEIPFGGAKQSGLGVELGEEGMAEFTQRQALHHAI